MAPGTGRSSRGLPLLSSSLPLRGALPAAVPPAKDTPVIPLLILLLTEAGVSASPGLPPASSPAFTKDARQTYVRNALVAFENAPKQKVDGIFQFITLVDRNKCRSAYENLT